MSEVSVNRQILNEREQQEHVRGGLRATSEPINRNSYDIEWLVQGLGAATINEIAHTSAAMERPLPYGATLIPYGIWNQFSEDGEPPALPDSAEAIDEAIRTFWPGKYSFPLCRYGQHIREEVQAETDQTLRRMLHGISSEGDADDAWTQVLGSLVDNRLTPEQWQQYTVAHERQISSGQRYTLDEVSSSAMMNFSFNERFGLFDKLLGRHRSFIFADSSYSVNMPVLAGTRIPIGPYGRELAEKLLLTASFMSLFDEQDYWLYNDAVTAENEGLIENHTTRAKGYDAPSLADSFVAGLREADEQALPLSLALLTSSRVKDYDAGDYDRLVRQLLIDDLIDELALRARQGLVASAALYGVFLPDPVEVRRNGHLRLSSQCIEVLRALQEISDRDGVQKLQEYQTALAAYEVAYQAWALAGRIGRPPQQPRELVRTWLACPYAGLNRSGETPVSGAISQRGPAVFAVYNCLQPLSESERQAVVLKRQKPPFGSLVGHLALSNHG